MEMKSIIQILLVAVASFACNPSSTTSAIPFLWDEEPEPSSTQIMVISTMAGEELRNALTIHLKSLGFVLESATIDKITTEPSRLEDNLIQLSLVIDNNVVIISGKKGLSQQEQEDIQWEPVEFENGKGYGSAEWELMNVLANNINNTSVLYN